MDYYWHNNHDNQIKNRVFSPSVVYREGFCGGNKWAANQKAAFKSCDCIIQSYVV